MQTDSQDCREAFARQLSRFRPWLWYILVWTILAGLAPLALLALDRLVWYPRLIPWIYGAALPALIAIWQAGRCPQCRYSLPNSRQPVTCPQCQCRLQ